MRRLWTSIVISLALGTYLGGCGSLPEDAGNRLLVVGVSSESGGGGGQFPGSETVTSDVGCPEGDTQTANNGFYDACSDEAFDPVVADLVDITVHNETRKGVDEGRPLEVYKIRITYFDEAGNTPPYAPQRTFGWAALVNPDADATLTGVPLTTKEMKAGFGAVTGLRDLFFTGQAGAQVTLTAAVDLFAKDSLNNTSFSVRTNVLVIFVNPNL